MKTLISTKIFGNLCLKLYNLYLRCQLRLLHAIELVIGHGHDGEDEVDEVEGAQEDVQDEEGDVEGAGGLQRDLVQVLPEVLGHQSEGAQERVREIVKTGVAIVGVGSVACVISLCSQNIIMLPHKYTQEGPA